MTRIFFLTLFAAFSAHAEESITLNVACSLEPGQVCAYDAPPGTPVECIPSGEMVCSCTEAVDAFRSEVSARFPGASNVRFVQSNGGLEKWFFRFGRDECIASKAETAVFTR